MLEEKGKKRKRKKEKKGEKNAHQRPRTVIKRSRLMFPGPLHLLTIPHTLLPLLLTFCVFLKANGDVFVVLAVGQDVSAK